MELIVFLFLSGSEGGGGEEGTQRNITANSRREHRGDGRVPAEDQGETDHPTGTLVQLLCYW